MSIDCRPLPPNAVAEYRHVGDATVVVNTVCKRCGLDQNQSVKVMVFGDGQPGDKKMNLAVDREGVHMFVRSMRCIRCGCMRLKGKGIYAE